VLFVFIDLYEIRIMKSHITLIAFCFPLFFSAQNISAKQLLENAINYHDPNAHWENFNGTFIIEMTRPYTSKRRSVISIDLKDDYFNIDVTKDTVNTSYTLHKDKCQLAYNGKTLDSLKAKSKNMSCNRARLYKNYYTYLYGLPMKLKDFGTNISETVETKTLKGKAYLVLKVTYDKAVGNDIWYFYFDPNTYAMEVYQFFKTDENGKEKPDSGEYIVLSEEVLVNGIKMPKVRAWYYNKNDQYIATDTLVFE
jgi:hypothetical protein